MKKTQKFTLQYKTKRKEKTKTEHTEKKKKKPVIINHEDGKKLLNHRYESSVIAMKASKM